MFHKEELEAYRSISAPESLKEKILMAGAKNIRVFPYRQVYLAVASLAVVAGLSATWNWNHSVISLQGSEQTISMASGAREVLKTTIEIEVNSSSKRKLTVSEGNLILNDEEGQKSLVVDSGTKLLWQLESQQGQEYKLLVTGWGRDKQYLLSYNQDNEYWEMKEQ